MPLEELATSKRKTPAEDAHSTPEDAVHVADIGTRFLCFGHELCVCIDELRTTHQSFQRKHTAPPKMECMLQMQVSDGAVLVTNYVHASMSYELCTCHLKETHITHEMECML